MLAHRAGQSMTPLSDGRWLLLGGERENGPKVLYQKEATIMGFFRQGWAAFLTLLFVSDFVFFLMLPVATYLLYSHGWALWKAFCASSFAYLIFLHVIWKDFLGGYPLFGGLFVAHIWTIVDVLIPWHQHQPHRVYGGHSQAEVDCLMILYSSIVLGAAPTILLWAVEKYKR